MNAGVKQNIVFPMFSYSFHSKVVKAIGKTMKEAGS